MKIVIKSEGVSDKSRVEEIHEELVVLAYNIEQPYWMCGRDQLNGWLLKKIHLLNELKNLKKS